jgi:hypothetical protein
VVFELADQKSAQEGLTIAKRHTEICRVPFWRLYGREYWKGDSGGTDSAPSASCLAYNPASLTVTDDGSGRNIFDLHSGSVSLIQTQGRALAVRLLRVAQQHTRLCTTIAQNAPSPAYGLDFWQ